MTIKTILSSVFAIALVMGLSISKVETTVGIASLSFVPSASASADNDSNDNDSRDSVSSGGTETHTTYTRAGDPCTCEDGTESVYVLPEGIVEVEISDSNSEDSDGHNHRTHSTDSLSEGGTHHTESRDSSSDDNSSVYDSVTDDTDVRICRCTEATITDPTFIPDDTPPTSTGAVPGAFQAF